LNHQLDKKCGAAFSKRLHIPKQAFFTDYLKKNSRVSGVNIQEMRFETQNIDRSCTAPDLPRQNSIKKHKS